MPTRRGPDDSVRIAISGSNQGVNMANVFHAQLTPSGTILQADLDAWTDAFVAAYKTRFSLYSSSSYAYSQAQTVLYVPGGLVMTSQRAVSGNGTGASSLTWQGGSAVVSWLSSVYWRGGKPRTYLPVLPDANLTNDKTLNPTPQAALQVAAGSFITDINALTEATITHTVLGFVSYSTGNAPRTPAVFFPVTGARVHPRPGSQRRRMGKWSA